MSSNSLIGCIWKESLLKKIELIEFSRFFYANSSILQRQYCFPAETTIKVLFKYFSYQVICKKILLYSLFESLSNYDFCISGKKYYMFTPIVANKWNMYSMRLKTKHGKHFNETGKRKILGELFAFSNSNSKLDNSCKWQVLYTICFEANYLFMTFKINSIIYGR